MKPCLVEGTRILVENMRTVPIEELEAGDYIQCLTENMVLKERKILDIQSCKQMIVININDELKSTLDHPFLVEGLGWVPANNLSIGDVMLTNNGDKSIYRKTTINSWFTVYDLIIDGAFFAEDFVTISKNFLNSNIAAALAAHASIKDTHSILAETLGPERGGTITMH